MSDECQGPWRAAPKTAPACRSGKPCSCARQTLQLRTTHSAAAHTDNGTTGARPPNPNPAAAVQPSRPPPAALQDAEKAAAAGHGPNPNPDPSILRLPRGRANRAAAEHAEEAAPAGCRRRRRRLACHSACLRERYSLFHLRGCHSVVRRSLRTPDEQKLSNCVDPLETSSLLPHRPRPRWHTPSALHRCRKQTWQPIPLLICQRGMPLVPAHSSRLCCA